LLSAKICGQRKLCTNKNSPVINRKCWLTQVGLYNSHKTVVVVVIVNKELSVQDFTGQMPFPLLNWQYSS